MRASPHSIATSAPRPSSDVAIDEIRRGVEDVGNAERFGGKGRGHQSRTSGTWSPIAPWAWCASASSDTTSSGNVRVANVVASTHATRYEASQISRPRAPLVDVEGEPDPPVADRGHPDADRDLVTQLRRRTKSGLQRRPRHEDVEAAQQRRAIAAEPAIEILFRMLEVAEEHAEPDDAGRIGVGPHHAEVDVMEQRHGRYNTDKCPASLPSRRPRPLSRVSRNRIG